MCFLVPDRRSSEATNHLEGRRLSLARAAWVGFALLILAVYVASIPAFYQWNIQDPYQFAPTLAQVNLSLRFFALYTTIFCSALVLACLTIALLIFWRKSNDWMGLLVSLALLCFAVLLPVVPALGIIYPAWQEIVVIIRYAAVLLILLVFYLFPDGRFIPGWTKYAILLWFLIFSMMLLVDIIPPATPNDLHAGDQVLVYLIPLLTFATGVYAQVYRYTHIKDAVVRQQTKWVVFGLSAVCIGGAIVNLPAIFMPSLLKHGVANFIYTMFNIPVLLFAWFLLPLSMGISIIKYRLWDIDLIIRRTLLYAALTIALVALYFSGVVFLQALFQSVTGQKREIAVIISTLVIAVVFNPLRTRIQKYIDRRFYHSEYNIQKAMEDFSAKLRNEVMLDQLITQLLGAVSDNMKPEHVSLWLRQSRR